MKAPNSPEAENTAAVTATLLRKWSLRATRNTACTFLDPPSTVRFTKVRAKITQP